MADEFPPPPPPGGVPVPGYMPQNPVPRTSSNAVVALVLAICAFVICPLVPAIVALFLASSAQREIDASGGWVTGTGLVQAAKIVSWINIAIFGLIVIGFLVVLIFGLAASTTSSALG